MCGLTGYWTPSGLDQESALHIDAMTDAIRSRGPDARGGWSDPAQGISLGHRRLSVLELSAAGAQPMISRSGRYVLVYNGEIYNHAEMRDRLGREGFSGLSDTETLLAGFERWGIGETLTLSTGMFALACWDRQERTILLARDRMGEKPLYFGWQGSGIDRTLLFGSELKALMQHPAFERVIDRDSVRRYWSRLNVPAPASIWAGIGKVPTGMVLKIRADGTTTEEPYWSLSKAIEAGQRDQLRDPQEIVDLLDRELGSAVARQLISDVPLGAFLSGGVDSSLIVALMQRANVGSTRTFSIGFELADYNEADHARAVAQHLGTDHHELIVTEADAQGVIPDLPDIYDEPFADSSQIPTFLVARLARSKVVVALSGDGADELFAGYTRHGKVLDLWRRSRRIPSALRNAAETLANRLPEGVPPRFRRGLHIACAPDAEEFYTRYTDHNPTLPLRGSDRVFMGRPDSLSPLERMMALDQETYLPDDILVKVDRAAMAVSLETRAPYLDHRVVEMSWRIPPDLKRRIVDGRTVAKWPLRALLDRDVPRELIERPKQGFGMPVGHWLRGALRDWADDLLSPAAVERIGLANPKHVASLWSSHRNGKADHSEQLWAALMMQGWAHRWLEGKPGSASERISECAA